MATLKKSSDQLGVDYNSFDGVPRGRHCIAFVRLSDSRGLKVYNDSHDRDRLYQSQRSLAQKGLAPGCDEKIDITMRDGSIKYAYVTVIADIAYDGMHGVETRTDYADRRGLTRDKVMSDLIDLKERLDCVGYNWRDCCIFNFGYCNGRAVLTDVDCE